jgi:hypothetical protein
VKVVELDWAPTVPKTEAPPQPQAQTAPAAAQTFEQAVAAQRLASSGTPAAASAAAAATTTPKPAGPKAPPPVQEKFAYCHADGGLPREASHRYYVSSTFVVPRGVSPDTAFGAFLRTAYPKEIVNGVRCSYPQAQNFTESARQEDLTSHQGAQQIQVVEVSWKGPAGGS